jgi:hypothetical protein
MTSSPLGGIKHVNHRCSEKESASWLTDSAIDSLTGEVVEEPQNPADAKLEDPQSPPEDLT